MGAFIAVLGFLAFSVGFLMFVFSIFKKKKKAKSLLIMSVSMVFFITGAIISGSNDVATQDSKPAADEKKDEKKPIKEDTEKVAEDQPAKEEPVAEKSVATEEDKAIESQANTDKKPATDKQKDDWDSKIEKIAQSKDSPTGKYDQVMILAKDYTPIKKEVEKFAVYIITEYQSKQYSADITNDEYMLKNIFRANVINNYIGKVNTPLNDFAFDFYQNTKYLYRGVDTVDSAAVRANERQMDKALAKM